MKIAQVILESGTWGNVGPEALQRGIGGREGALIRLATEWARLGHEVTNFVPTDKAKRFNEFEPSRHMEQMGYGYFRNYDETPPLFKPYAGFHEYVPAKLARPMLASFPYDAVVAWECPEIYANEAVVEQQKVRLVHMQVAHMKNMDAAEEFSTGVVALSQWALDFLVHSGLSMNGDKLYVRPNGVNIADYPWDPKKLSWNNKKFSMIYSSSPDRGLLNLLKIWPDIYKNKKGSKLFVAYGAKDWTTQVKWAHAKVGEMALQIEQLLNQPGVFDLGKIGQQQLAKYQREASIWLYPADTIQATETGCITAIENMAAGNLCLMSDVDCLESEFGKGFIGGKGKISEYPPPAIIEPLPVDTERWAEMTVELLKNDDWVVRRLAARTFSESRDWSAIAPTWIDLFKDNRA